MKKNRILWMCVVLMMAIGMSSCSRDDEDNTVPQINKENGTIEDFFNRVSNLMYPLCNK